jgi:type I restriction enzyme S subunit
MSYKDEWKGYTVKELIDKSIIAKPLDGNHGNYHPKGNDFIENGIPFVMASDLQHGKINYNSCKFISKKQAKRLRKGFSINGDILITHKATIGRTAIVKNTPTDFIILTPQVTYYRVLNEEKLNRIFLKYYFDSVKFQDLIHSWAGGGSTRLYIGITAQLKLPIKFPSIRTQNRIASILSAFDEKIEVNRQMNATLEAMAQAMFREMCLPDDEESLEDGWEWKKIGDLVDTVSNTYKFKGIDEIIFLNTGDVSKGFVQHHDYRPTKGLPGQAKKRIQKDDIL